MLSSIGISNRALAASSAQASSFYKHRWHISSHIISWCVAIQPYIWWQPSRGTISSIHRQDCLYLCAISRILRSWSSAPSVTTISFAKQQTQQIHRRSVLSLQVHFVWRAYTSTYQYYSMVLEKQLHIYNTINVWAYKYERCIDGKRQSTSAHIHTTGASIVNRNTTINKWAYIYEMQDRKTTIYKWAYIWDQRNDNQRVHIYVRYGVHR